MKSLNTFDYLEMLAAIPWEFSPLPCKLLKIAFIGLGCAAMWLLMFFAA